MMVKGRSHEEGWLRKEQWEGEEADKDIYV